MEKIQMIW